MSNLYKEAVAVGVEKGKRTGKREGKIEGRLENILEQLHARLPTPPAEILSTLRDTRDEHVLAEVGRSIVLIPRQQALVARLKEILGLAE